MSVAGAGGRGEGGSVGSVAAEVRRRGGGKEEGGVLRFGRAGVGRIPYTAAAAAQHGGAGGKCSSLLLPTGVQVDLRAAVK